MHHRQINLRHTDTILRPHSRQLACTRCHRFAPEWPLYSCTLIQLSVDCVPNFRAKETRFSTGLRAFILSPGPNQGLTRQPISKTISGGKATGAWSYPLKAIKRLRIFGSKPPGRLRSENACYHSVQNRSSSSLLSKNININIHRTIILPVVLYGCATWSSHWGRNVGLRIRCWGEYLGRRRTR